jgi:hypothetical protein
MNAFAFASSSAGWFVYPAVVLGLVIPGMIYMAIRFAGELYLTATTRCATGNHGRIGYDPG